MQNTKEIQLAATLTSMASSEGLQSRSVGSLAGWAVPVRLWYAPLGLDTSQQPEQRACHALMWRVSGEPLRRVLPSRETLEEMAPDGFLLQPAARELRLLASGPVQWAECSLSDDFLRGVAIESAGPEGCLAELFQDERTMRRDARLVAMLDDYLRQALQDGPEPTRIEMDSRATLLALWLLREHSVSRRREVRHRRGGLSPWHLRRVCEAMTRDLGAAVPLQSLAEMLDLSYHHFCHAFKASAGMAPYQWLVERRVERACELLRATRHSIGDVAAAVGYDDPNQLARVFRARRGTSPVAYRRECRSWSERA
ncbi:MAG TPA: AraC family transcriptional regulator [Ideonella sp.]|nr:AraC family transcriptional regulator [Ideonella sp.]